MSYLYLGAAIACELIGTTFMKYSHGFTKLWPSVLTLVFYGLCYIAFSRALLSINLSVAYATWCGIGIVAATLLSLFLFKESITFLGIVGILLVLVGVIILNTCGVNH